MRALKDKFSKYQKSFAHRRQGRWKEPFEVHDTPPIVLKDMVVGDGKAPLGEMKMDMQFTKEALMRYDELNKNPDFMNVCKTPEAILKLLDLLLLDIRVLLSCDPLATKGKNEIREDSPSPDAAAGTVLRDAASDADNSNSDQDGAKDTAAEVSQPSAYLLWQPYAPMVVKWDELGLTDPNVIECSNFFPACAFFFYIDALAKAHPGINNALHKAWLDKFKTRLDTHVC